MDPQLITDQPQQPVPVGPRMRIGAPAQATGAPVPVGPKQSVRNAPDYDMPGYIAKYGQPDQSKGQHLTDEFKLPNHMTFSTDSKYSNDTQKGGEWRQQNGVWHFYASPFNLQMHTAQELQDYFRRAEPNSVLHLPQEGNHPLMQAAQANPNGEKIFRMIGEDGKEMGVPYSVAKQLYGGSQAISMMGAQAQVGGGSVINSPMPRGQFKFADDAETQRFMQQYAADPQTAQEMAAITAADPSTDLIMSFAKHAMRLVTGGYDIAKAAGELMMGPASGKTPGEIYEEYKGTNRPESEKSGFRQFTESPDESFTERAGGLAEEYAETEAGTRYLRYLKLFPELKGAQKVVAAGKVATLAEKYPVLAEALAQGTFAGGQTMTKTHDPLAAAEAGIGTTAAGAFIGGITDRLGRNLRASQPGSHTIMGQEFETPAPKYTPKPTKNQAAGQNVITQTAKDVAGQHLEELNETRRGNEAQPTKPFPGFTLRGPRNLQDVSEKGSVVRGQPTLRTGAPPEVKGGLPQPRRFSVEGPTPVAGHEGQIAHSARKQPQPAAFPPKYQTASAASREGIPGPYGQHYTPPNEGTMGADISTRGAPEAQSDVARGGGTLHTADPEILKGNLDNLNQIIDGKEFSKLPPEQQRELLRARANAQRQVAEMGTAPFVAATPEQTFARAGMRLEHQPATVEPAVAPGISGGGVLQTQDPNIARAHLATVDQIINSKEFESFSPAEQEEFRQIRQETADQMAAYHAAVPAQVRNNVPGYGRPMMPEANPAQFIPKVGSHTDAANVILGQAKAGYNHITDALTLAGEDPQKLNQVRLAYQNAEQHYFAADTEAGINAARGEIKDAEDQLAEMIDRIPNAITVKEFSGLNDAYRNGLDLAKFGDAIDSSFGTLTSSKPGEWEYRGFSGDILGHNLTTIVKQLGGRGPVERLVGRDNLDALFQVAHLNSTPEGRAKWGAAVEKTAESLIRMHVGPIAAGGYLGRMLGMKWEVGAAMGWATAKGIRKLNQIILSRPELAQKLLYALDKGAKPSTYGPILATAIRAFVEESNRPPQEEDNANTVR